MPSGEAAVLAGWTLYLWLVGWAVFPVTSRLLGGLPDRGLAAGRLAFVIGATLLCFFGASARLIPLGTAAPLWFWILPLVAATEWRKPEVREKVSRLKKRFLASDAVFLAAWAFFVWVRLKNSSANDLEKPMDMALIAGAMRANFLPFENPWFAGQAFTNYYYFGPLMGAMLARSLGTVPWLAYNLVQPAFCAFFLSVLWSGCAALTGSVRWGLAAAVLVGMGGNLEPLRQMAAGHFWPLDWWATSRVMPDTINEYPAFTLLIGDAHAHFYALSLTALFITIGANLILETDWGQRRHGLILGGVVLGVVLLTNTWDAPLLGLLLTVLVIRLEGKAVLKRLPFLAGCFVLSVLVALPYFLRFKSQVSGVKFDPWIPPLGGFLLLWGFWVFLAGLSFWMTEDLEQNQRPVGYVTETLVLVGLVALVVPFFFYIRGAFGDGQFRHMDTTFKFGLQAWLLLGTGAACEAFRRIRLWLPAASLPARFAAWYGFACAAALLSLAPLCVLHTRTSSYAPPEGGLSLNAMRFLTEGEQGAVRWLYAAPPGKVLGPTGRDFEPMAGRFSTFSGQTAILGWPDHVRAWGANLSEVQRRQSLNQGLYRLPTPQEVDQLAKDLEPAYIILPGQPEDLTNFDARDAIEKSRIYGTPEFHGGTEEKPEYPVVVRYRLITNRKYE